MILDIELTYRQFFSKLKRCRITRMALLITVLKHNCAYKGLYQKNLCRIVVKNKMKSMKESEGFL